MCPTKAGLADHRPRVVAVHYSKVGRGQRECNRNDEPCNRQDPQCLLRYARAFGVSLQRLHPGAGNGKLQAENAKTSKHQRNSGAGEHQERNPRQRDAAANATDQDAPQPAVGVCAQPFNQGCHADKVLARAAYNPSFPH